MTHEATEDFSPRDPRTVVGKQDGRDATSGSPALAVPELEKEEEKEDAADPLDASSCCATYSNLGEC